MVPSNAAGALVKAEVKDILLPGLPGLVPPNLYPGWTNVVPLYVPDCTEEELQEEVSSHRLLVLNKFTRTIRPKPIKELITRYSLPPSLSMDAKEKKEVEVEEKENANPSMPGQTPMLSSGGRV